MEDKLRLLAEQLANKNKSIQFTHNSVLTASDEFGMKNQIAGKIAGQLSNDVSEIRNILLPVVKDYAAKVNKKIVDTKQPNQLAKYTIVEQKIPYLVTELQDKKYIITKRKPIQIPTSTLIIPIPETGVASIASFKNSLLDNLLGQILTGFTESELTKIWDKYLGNVSGTNDSIRNMPYRTLENLNEIIVIMAIVYNLKGEKPKGVRISDSNYKSTMNDFYNEIANNIASAIEKYDITTKIGRLILGTKNETTLVVNGTLYEKYLEKESLEPLLGILLAGDADKVTALQDVLIEAGKYLNKWEMAVKREQIRETYQQATRYRLAYNLVITDLVNGMSEEAKALMECTPGMIAKETEILVNSLDGATVSDIDLVARHIVGKLVFPSTNLFKFLNYMGDYAKINPNITPDESATMAALDIIVDYLSMQFEIKE